MARRQTCRVLMFSTYFPPQYSGAAKQAIALARHLDKRGHHVEFATVRWPGLSEEEVIDGFHVRRLERGRSRKHREFRLWWNLFRYCWSRREDFDIVHSHGAYYANSVVGLLARTVGWHSVVKASLADNDLHGIRRSTSGKLHFLFLRLVNGYVATSEDLCQEFLAAGLAPRKLFHLPNGVDTERFQPADAADKAALRGALGLPTDRLISLAVGVLDRRKNLGWLMEEWCRHRSFGTGGLLVVVGPQSRDDPTGDFRGALERLASAHSTDLVLVGEVNDIEKYYRAADLFILPSHNEGMPNVLLEAMASGLPCVATAVSGTRDLVREGETGYTFAPNDSDGLQRALHNTLHGDIPVIASRCRDVAVSGYGLPVLAERYEDLYRRLMG